MGFLVTFDLDNNVVWMAQAANCGSTPAALANMNVLSTLQGACRAQTSGTGGSNGSGSGSSGNSGSSGTSLGSAVQPNRGLILLLTLAIAVSGFI
jgi:hypothetical protein